ncbi:MAG: hypothetical protein FWH07_06990 [Oscillospiraceae bacterium]|nr:hypothetical protein [Oscillospiraceae bacterium]
MVIKMKKINFMLIAVLLIMSMVALNGCEPPHEVTVTPDEIFSHFVENELFEPPYMLDIDPGRLGDYNVKPDDAVSFIAKEAAISAVFIQIIIINAGEDKVNDVHEAMLEHQSNLKDDVFYPQGVAAANASIVGVKGDLVYLLCDERAQELEEILLNFIA